eukprot:GFUD01095799.1.p1 GENE.GFUD01095799.1~~GFUD01095799.1.p1  ORF type:complete len:200 (+),score=58.04 GFUD01095799.1:41-601(+)
MADSEVQPERRKVVVVGDSETGKTSLLHRVSNHNGELPKFPPTIMSNQLIKVNLGEESLSFMVFDTAGQEEYDRLRPLSYPNTDVLWLVCTMDKPDTLLNMKFKWLKEVNHYCPRAKKILVINKCDLEGCADGLTDENLEAAYVSMKMDTKFKVSAATGENVDSLIQATGKLATEKRRTYARCKIF